MNEMIAKARQETEDGNRAAARSLLSKVVSQDTENAEAWYLLSQVVEPKIFALYCLEQALRVDSNHRPAKEARRRLRSSRGRPAGAKEREGKGGAARLRRATSEVWREILEALGASSEEQKEALLRDLGEAMTLSRPAADLKYAPVYHELGDMYLSGIDVKADAKQALEFYEKAAQLGDELCWGDMAICCYELKDFECADECWGKFLEKVYVKDKVNAPAYYVLSFYQYMRFVSGRVHDEALVRCFEEIGMEVGEG